MNADSLYLLGLVVEGALLRLVIADIGELKLLKLGLENTKGFLQLHHFFIASTSCRNHNPLLTRDAERKR